jgi:bifunctional DNA-binding transcriptional regulator/antitoxin component of YhaV-PrlF toxin-antitoxin module
LTPVKRNKKIRFQGAIKVLDPRGFAYLPSVLRRELDAKKGSSLPFFIAANIVLLVRSNCPLEDILRSIDILKEDIKLRWREEPEAGETYPQ